MLSKGMITLDKNKKMEPDEIAARVAVSSEVKRCPMSIPRRIKKVVMSRSEEIRTGRLARICALKNWAEIRMMIMICITTSSNAVR